MISPARPRRYWSRSAVCSIPRFSLSRRCRRRSRLLRRRPRPRCRRRRRPALRAAAVRTGSSSSATACCRATSSIGGAGPRTPRRGSKPVSLVTRARTRPASRSFACPVVSRNCRDQRSTSTSQSRGARPRRTNRASSCSSRTALSSHAPNTLDERRTRPLSAAIRRAAAGVATTHRSRRSRRPGSAVSADNRADLLAMADRRAGQHRRDRAAALLAGRVSPGVRSKTIRHSASSSVMRTSHRTSRPAPASLREPSPRPAAAVRCRRSPERPRNCATGRSTRCGSSRSAAAAPSCCCPTRRPIGRLSRRCCRERCPSIC